jgi:hypothetical protein
MKSRYLLFLIGCFIISISSYASAANTNTLECITEDGIQYTIAGEQTILKCVFPSVESFTATWIIGTEILEESIETSGDNSYNISLAHNFSDEKDIRIIANISGETYEESFIVKILADTEENRKNKAVEDAVWYMHTKQKRYSFGKEIYGYWTHDYLEKWAVGYTSLALIAYEAAGYSIDSNNPYSEDMRRALHYILSTCDYQMIGEQYRGDPDSNGNSIGLVCMHLKSHTNYEAGLSLAAVASLRDSSYVSTVGGPFVYRRNLKDISQDMIDWLVWAQNENIAEAGGHGAWYYTENSKEGDMSVTQWPIFGILIAESNLGLSAPEWIKEESAVWLQRVQGEDGSFSYRGRGNSNTGNVALSGSALTVSSYIGFDKESESVVHAREYIGENWETNKPQRRQDNLGNFYSMNNVMRASVLYNISDYNSIDWEESYTNWLLENQKPDGSWLDKSWLKLHIGPTLATSWGVMVLENSQIYQMMK